MKREYAFVDIRLGDELRRAAFLWRYGKGDEQYLYAVDDPDAESWVVRIYTITDEDDESYVVRELRSVLHWESLLNALQEARGHPRSDSLRNVVADIGGKQTPLSMRNLVPLDGREFIVYVGETEPGDDMPPIAVMECWMDGGVPCSEAVTDEEILQRVLFGSGRSTVEEPAHDVVVVCQGDEEISCRRIGIVELDEERYLVLSPLTPDNATGIIRVIYRCTTGPDGDEQLSNDIPEEVFTRVAEKASKLEEAPPEEPGDGGPDDPDDLNIC